MWYWFNIQENEWIAELELSTNIHYQMTFMKKENNIWEIDYWPIAVGEIDLEIQKQIDMFSTGTPNAKWPFNTTKLYKLMLNSIDDFIKNNHPLGLTAFTQIYREPQKKLHVLLAEGLVKRHKGYYNIIHQYDNQAGDIERVIYYL